MAANDVGSMIAGPESMEYPIETAGTEPQVVALAASSKGEVTCAPFAGVVTVMAAARTHDSSAASRAEKRSAESKFFTEKPQGMASKRRLSIRLRADKNSQGILTVANID